MSSWADLATSHHVLAARTLKDSEKDRVVRRRSPRREARPQLARVPYKNAEAGRRCIGEGRVPFMRAYPPSWRRLPTESSWGSALVEAVKSASDRAQAIANLPTLVKGLVSGLRT